MTRIASFVLPFALVCSFAVPAQADTAETQETSISMNNAHDRVLDVLDSAVRRDQSRWLAGAYHGGMTLTDLDENKGKVFVTGTFRTKGILGILTRHFTAVLKSVGGSYTVQQCCWETAVGTPWCVQ